MGYEEEEEEENILFLNVKLHNIVKLRKEKWPPLSNNVKNKIKYIKERDQ